MNIEKEYLKLMETILEKGHMRGNRTNTDAITHTPTMLQHDMSIGFPLLTTKKMGIKTISAELEFFIKGLTDKQWLKDRKCKIWNEWCNPDKIPSGLTDLERKEYQSNENDLGPIYGYQWRNFNSQDYDQLENVLNTLKEDPNNRRMVCSAWNPLQFNQMALPPCHIMWGVQVLNGKLNLWWTQRSVDVFLGLGYNITSYALLLKLLAKESGLGEGILTGFLVDVHIYENHIDQVKKQLNREMVDLPTLDITNFNGIFNWEYTDTDLKNYNPHPSIKGKVAI